MSNIKALRNRIKSVTSTQKITKAMRMVSASKLHKAKESADFTKQYRAKISSILNSVKTNLDDSTLSHFSQTVFYKADSYNKTIAIIYSSDRGLCGAFNSSLYRKVKKELCSHNNLKIITIGKKLNDLLNKSHHILAHFALTEKPASIATKVTDLIKEEIEQDSATQVIIYYTKFKNTLIQIPTKQVLIPIEIDDTATVENLNVEFEGDNIIERLTQLYCESNIVSDFFESRASEEASRMTAMDNATQNAGDMINKLTLKMNRTRQACITRELIEVISGAEAL